MYKMLPENPTFLNNKLKCQPKATIPSMEELFSETKLIYTLTEK